MSLRWWLVWLITFALLVLGVKTLLPWLSAHLLNSLVMFEYYICLPHKKLIGWNQFENGWLFSFGEFASCGEEWKRHHPPPMECVNISSASTQRANCASHHVAVKSDQHAVAICFQRRGVCAHAYIITRCWYLHALAGSEMSTHSAVHAEAALDLLFRILCAALAEPAARPSAAQLADYTRRESVSPEFQCTEPRLPAQNSARERRWSAHMDFARCARVWGRDY
jgi:hypothetical protein